jgi:hypothetical protein
LDRDRCGGLKFLKDTGHRETFTVESLSTVFVGLIEEARYSNDVGEGGFTPAASATLTVEREQFWFSPWMGMRVMVWGREHQVSEVSENPYRWVLSLIVSHPRAHQDLPKFCRVLTGVTGTPLFGPAHNPLTPS